MKLSQTRQIIEMEPHRTHQAEEPMLSAKQEELSHMGLLQPREAQGESFLIGPSA